MKATVEKFGGIDILVNNASAISLTGVEQTEMKRYDLMHSANTRGTFLVSKTCIPHLKRAANPHVLNLSPPLNTETRWFAPHVAYTMAKFGMSMCVLGMAGEYKTAGIAFNALWPRPVIATSAVQNLLGGPAVMKGSRKPAIMADAAHAILLRPARECTGTFFIDDEALAAAGKIDLSGTRTTRARRCFPISSCEVQMRTTGFVLLAACGGASTIPGSSPADLAIRDVRVFDGEHVLEHQTVLVAHGEIAAVEPAARLANAAATKVVDGSGKTLLPGLIDAHAHVNSDDDPKTALAFGVTTEIDMMSSPEVSVRLAHDDAAVDHAHVVPAGFAATVPGGHGTEYGGDVPTLTRPDEAEAFVAARVREGSHHLKIILETGAEIGTSIPSLDAPTTKALVLAAHRHHLLAVAHVGSAADVAQALDAGIDGLAHVPGQALDAATIRRIAAAHVFVSPTLTVLAAVCGRHSGIEKDPALAPLISPATEHWLAGGFSFKIDCDAAAANVHALRAAGVTLMAGTDAPNPGTGHGVSLHDELARLVDAGLSPVEALVAGTAAPARAFGLANVGVIRPGATADLLLVDGDPTRQILATRAISAVWRGGVGIDLAKRRADVAAAWKAADDSRTMDKRGLLADFDADHTSPTARYGAIHAASDKLMGGTSTAATAIADGGAAGTAHALAVTGTVVAAAANTGLGWAGMSFLPDPSFQPVDLSAVKRVRFWVRGDGKRYALFAFGHGRVVKRQPFVVTKEWNEVVIDADKLGPLDAVVGFTWSAIDGGPFAFQIDQISFE